MEQALKKILCLEPTIKYRLPKMNNKKVLILSPHPDDETLGCGGVIHNLIKKEYTIDIVLMTNGNCKEMGEGIEKKRIKEFKSALEVLCCKKAHFLGFPDGQLKYYEKEAIIKLSKIIENIEPDIIFVPYIFDINDDHKATNKILANSINNISDLNIAMYEVWTPILYPNCYIDISEEFHCKSLAIDCYKSQEEIYEIKDITTTLNSFRAMISRRRNVNFIESFKCLKVDDYVEIINLTEKLNF
ncbi:MAG: PIG-L deacetylase family protein [Clostridiaceae bacterium]